MTRPLSGTHAVVVAELAADHERLHGRPVTGELFRGIWDVCAVLTVVDADFAKVSVRALVGFVMRVRPLAAITDTCRTSYCQSRRPMHVDVCCMMDRCLC